MIPTRGTAREVRARARSPGRPTACAASSPPRPTTNYEIVVVADTATDRGGASTSCAALGGDRLRLVPYDQPFNFSDKINIGALASQGEHLLLLNDDMEVVTPDWIERLVMYSAFPGIGAVGGPLLFGDGRLQHVGVDARQRAARPPLPGLPRRLGGYANMVRVANNYTAVTGACLMTPPGRVRRGGRAVDGVPAQLQRRRLLPEAAGAWASGSSTTPTRSSTTSSRPAARPRCRDWEFAQFSGPLGPRHRGRPLRQPQLPSQLAEHGHADLPRERRGPHLTSPRPGQGGALRCAAGCGRACA